jgi:transcriptional regulator with XRE-family HTH domain
MLITLRAARTNIGLNRKEAAKLFEIHYETLANYEADSSNIPHTFFAKIEPVYGLPKEAIYFGKEKDHFKSYQDRLEKQGVQI